MLESRRKVSPASTRKASLAGAGAVLALLALGWWMIVDRPSLLSGTDPQSRALREYMEAARRRDCASVIAALSRRSRELAKAAVAGRSTLDRSFCNYSPATARLSEFETDRIRREDVSGPVAHVSASYTYDRFFGFYGRGRRRYTYTLVLEDAGGRIDLVEQLDQESRTNRNRRAMFLVQQAWTAITPTSARPGHSPTIPMLFAPSSQASGSPISTPAWLPPQRSSQALSPRWRA